MKKLGIVLFLISLFNTVKGQKIVDNDLKAMILSRCPTCLDNNGNLLSRASTITNLEMLAISNFSIKTTKGLEGFTNLKTFFIENINFADSLNVFDSLPPKLDNLKLRLTIDKIAKFYFFDTLKKWKINFVFNTFHFTFTTHSVSMF